MNVLSVGCDSKIFELRSCQRKLKLALKVSQSRKKCEQPSTSSLQKKSSASMVLHRDKCKEVVHCSDIIVSVLIIEN